MSCDTALPPREMTAILQGVASQGDLLNYLTVFRLLLQLAWANLEQARAHLQRHAQLSPMAHLLVEHLQICFNCFEWSLIDFDDVEDCLDDLVEWASAIDDRGQGSRDDREELASTVTMAAQIYYMYIRGRE